MSKELVFGRQKPSIDVIAATMALSYFQNQLGYETEAAALGEPNDETKFVLKTLGMGALHVIKIAVNEIDKVMLVDYGELQQSVSGIDKATVTHLVDHHRIADFETAQLLWATVCLYGCISTIITELLQEKHINIPTSLAGMTLSAIISDTLLLKSPTTINHNREAVKYLAKIAGVEDYEKYGAKMLKADISLGAKSDADVADGDAKTFELNGKEVRIDQISTIDLDDVFIRQADSESQIQSMMDDNDYDLFLLIAANVLNSDPELLAIGDPAGKAEVAFGKKLNESKRMSLPDVVSRKKQTVPPSTDAFED